MSNKYKRTSTEELTAMADELRAIGTFTEGQEFVFPDSSVKEPTITYWIYTTEWVEKTAEEAAVLTDYTPQNVIELPTTGEANILYVLYTYQLGFAEGYDQAIQDFWDKVFFGTLTQEDVNDIVYSEPIDIFGNIGRDMTNSKNAFPTIKNLTIDGRLLQNQCFERLSALETLNLVNMTNDYSPIAQYCFATCYKLNNFPCKVGTVYPKGFFKCKSLTKIIMSNQCTSIGDSAFAGCEALEEVYLPDTPPNLSTTAFDNTPQTLKFYVTSSTIKDNYNDVTNWQPYISQFEVIST